MLNKITTSELDLIEFYHNLIGKETESKENKASTNN